MGLIVLREQTRRAKGWGGRFKKGERQGRGVLNAGCAMCCTNAVPPRRDSRGRPHCRVYSQTTWFQLSTNPTLITPPAPLLQPLTRPWLSVSLPRLPTSVLPTAV